MGEKSEPGVVGGDSDASVIGRREQGDDYSNENRGKSTKMVKIQKKKTTKFDYIYFSVIGRQ
jgi:hypothetical protein